MGVKWFQNLCFYFSILEDSLCRATGLLCSVFNFEKRINQWHSQPKIWGGAKCMILGEQHYFVWKNAFQSTK